MKSVKKFKSRVVWLMFRLLRGQIVRKMRATKATWTYINRVLRALEQEQILKVEKYKNGDRLIYGKAPRAKKLIIKDGRDPSVFTTEVTPKLRDRKKEEYAGESS